MGRCEEQGRESAKSLFPPASPDRRALSADEQHHSVGKLGRKPGTNRENTYFTDGKVEGSRKISVPQMTPYLRTQLSPVSTFWVLDPELLFPAENRTPVHPAPSPAQQQESKGRNTNSKGRRGGGCGSPLLPSAAARPHVRPHGGALSLGVLRRLCLRASVHPAASSTPGIWGWPQTPAPLPGEDFLADSAQSQFHHSSAVRSLPWAQDDGNSFVSFISYLLSFL